MKDKITLIWILLLPIFLIVINLFVSGEILKSMDQKLTAIALFLSFITMMILLNGIAIEIANIREQGALKSYVMLAGSKYPFLFAIILSQMIVLFISLEVMTILTSLVLNIFSLKLLLYVVIYTILLLPISVIFLAIALLPFKASSLATISSIITIIFYYFSNSHLYGFEWLNPLYFFRSFGLLILNNFTDFNGLILLIYVLYFLIGYISLVKLDINSKTIR
ncbi:hypothetical protein [Mammaliicoccus stepanovicii]|nr:hypothetical protein [Mammaliicoccus stepanovicii]